MSPHPRIADRRRRVIRTRFEMRREWIADRRSTTCAREESEHG